MGEQRGRAFGVVELVLAAVAVCVMSVVGIAAASAFTQTDPSTATPSAELSTTPVSLEPIAPAAEIVAPVAQAPQGVRVSNEWVSAVDARTGIGDVALRAYGTATLRLAKEQPTCRLGWTTLAGIGGIESLHGTDGGSYLLADGRTSQPILGPALDGSGGTAAIRSTAESVTWHGDAQWDHAVGPMQFIPSTWQRWQSDGNDDGTSDPNDVFDAAYAAGRYLCASGSDLSAGPGWTRAIFSYNHSDDYVRSVLAYANAYAK